MTAALSVNPPAGGWTTDDLDALPEDGLRRELLDGVLLVPPPPPPFIKSSPPGSSWPSRRPARVTCT